MHLISWGVILTVSVQSSEFAYFTNGTTGPFEFRNYFLASSHLKVVLISAVGVQTPLTLGANYTVTGAGNPGGGFITTVIAYPADGSKIAIERDVPISQELDYLNADGFPADSHERGLDKLTMIAQQTQAKTDRSLRVPIGESISELPPLEVRRNTIQGYDSQGNPTAALPTSDSAQALRIDLATPQGAGLMLFGGEEFYQPDTVGKRLQQYPSIQDFWRPGDGTDYTAALQRAIDSGEPVIDGLRRTYTIGGSVTGRGNLKLKNATFNLPSMSPNAYAIDFSGTAGTAQVLAVDHARAVWTMTVPNAAAFTEDGWVFVKSDEYWSAPANDNVKYGELLRIAGISGNVLTFYWPTLLAYTTAKAATIAPINMLRDIILEDVKANGPNSINNEAGFRFNMCEAPQLRDVRTTGFDYAHTVFERTAEFMVRGGSGSKTGVQEGLDYGVAVGGGCYRGTVDGYHGASMRHLLTIGGSQGISRHINAINCTGMNLTNAGLDSHSACYEHTFTGNTLHFSDFDTTTMDGIATQGGMPIIGNNHIYNCKRHGIAWIPETLAAFDGPIAGVFSPNQLHRPRNDGSSSGLLVSTFPTGSGYAPITSVDIGAQIISGFSNAVVVQASQSQIQRVGIGPLKCDTPMLSRSIFINAVGSDIDSVEIIGGHHEVADSSTNPVIDLIGTDSFKVKNWRVTAPHMKRGTGGTTGLRVIKTDNGTETGSTTENVTVKYSVDADSIGVTLDRRQSAIVTATNASYTVLAQDEELIVNRSGSVTLTLPSPVIYPSRYLTIKTVQAQAVVSAASDVVPIEGGAADTAILPATDGAWARLKSDGTNWIVMQRGS